MTSRIEVIEWFNRKIPEYRENYLSRYSGQTRKKVMKEYQVLTDTLLKHVRNSAGYPFKFMLRWKFDSLWSECTWIAAHSEMNENEIRIHNTVVSTATELLREFDCYFKIGRCK